MIAVVCAGSVVEAQSRQTPPPGGLWTDVAARLRTCASVKPSASMRSTGQAKAGAPSAGASPTTSSTARFSSKSAAHRGSDGPGGQSEARGAHRRRRHSAA